MHKHCKRCFQKLSEYLDGELDTPVCEEIHEHLLECPQCSDFLESLKKTLDICKKLPEQKIPEETRQRLRATLRDYLSGNRDETLAT